MVWTLDFPSLNSAPNRRFRTRFSRSCAPRCAPTPSIYLIGTAKFYLERGTRRGHRLRGGRTELAIGTGAHSPCWTCSRRVTRSRVRDALLVPTCTCTVPAGYAASAADPELRTRLPAPAPYPDAALPTGPASPRDLPRTGRRVRSHGSRRTLMGRARLPGPRFARCPLRCGILAYGFARARCAGCGYDFPLWWRSPAPVGEHVRRVMPAAWSRPPPISSTMSYRRFPFANGCCPFRSAYGRSCTTTPRSLALCCATTLRAVPFYALFGPRSDVRARERGSVPR
ncbi:MAG: hypothetical protein BMS9Abin29_2236 [Gemmatimonadota bacterium]|nr:MAG: hypothetical protein BMS9Abin29_2236 [Gemmatimonadota bacterium]